MQNLILNFIYYESETYGSALLNAPSMSRNVTTVNSRFYADPFNAATRLFRTSSHDLPD